MTFCPKCKTSLQNSTSGCPVCGSLRPCNSSGSDAAPTGIGATLQGYWQTTVQILFQPARFFARIDRTVSLFEVFLYGLAVNAIGTLAAFFWADRLMQWFDGLLPASMSALWNSAASTSTLLYAPLFGMASIILNTVFVFITLRFFARTKTPFKLVLRMISYAQAGMILSIIPLAGPIMAPLWSIWLYLNGMSAIAGISRLKAFMLLVLPLLILGFLTILLIILAVLGIGIFSLDMLKDSLTTYR